MNKTNIDWPNLAYSWNPVVGCKHGCKYCYAKRINDRFKFIPEWTRPQFFIERLREPQKVKKSSTIFVGSMCDLFGDYIDSNWINQVIKITENNPHHTFMFLTKNPRRYSEFKFPLNCWLGFSATRVMEFLLRNPCMKGIENKKFISIEPLLGAFWDEDFKPYDLIIVGAMTGPGAIKPEIGWIESIKHHNIYFKENIKKYVSS